MSSSKERVEQVMEQLTVATGGNVSSRAMMGEYVVYYRNKVIGGIYNDRFLIKPTESAKQMLPQAPLEIPYNGAKEMIRVNDLEDREFIGSLFAAMYEELPEPKRKTKN